MFIKASFIFVISFASTVWGGATGDFSMLEVYKNGEGS